MKCLFPIPLRRFSRREAIEHGYDGWLEVPCGRCAACKKERKKEWGLRMLLEAETYRVKGVDSCFVTLTYDNLNVPLVAGKKGVHLNLDKKDFTDFMKRFRERLAYAFGDRVDFSYYMSAEYGEDTFRPHFHIIFMGIPLSCKSLIEESWQKGHVEADILTLGTCNYVAGYVQKKLYGDVAEEEYDLREYPFSSMSKGIGLAYFQQHGKQIFEDGYISVNGHKMRIPRYFWKQVEAGKIDGLTVTSVKAASSDRISYVREYLDRTYVKLGLVDPESIAVYKQQQIDALAYNLKREAELRKRNKI